MVKRVWRKKMLRIILRITFLSCFLFSLAYTQNESTSTIHVIDDNGRGVKSEIFKVTVNGNLDRLGETDVAGILIVKIECKIGERLKIEPIGKYLNRFIECSNAFKGKIKVTEQMVYANLVENLQHFEENNDWAKISLISNELYSRSLEQNSGDVWNKPETIYSNFASFLEVTDPIVFDPSQDRFVISPKLNMAIKEFQAKKNLRITGNLDYMTLCTAAESTIGKYIFNKIR